MRIDLHTHTDQSDGTSAPDELVRQALAVPLGALAITDHDTFAGYEQAAPVAREAGLELVRGIELSTRLSLAGCHGRAPTAHLLGYFVQGEPSAEFRAWLQGQGKNRDRRNVALIAKLRSLGVDITLEEVKQVGRNQTGRPHFASVLVRKGYALNHRQAYDFYLADEARAAVEREQVPVGEGLRRLREAGAVPVLAHPIRMPFGPADERLIDLLGHLKEQGLEGLECQHSEHSAEDVAAFQSLARKLDLKETGGSDFHGGNKPDIDLGTGRNGNVHVAYEQLEALRTPR